MYKSLEHTIRNISNGIVESVELSEAKNFDPNSNSHKQAKTLTKGWKGVAKAEYHPDGSATIHARGYNGISSATVADKHLEKAGGWHNYPEKELADHKQTIHGLNYHVKKGGPNIHTINIKESLNEDIGNSDKFVGNKQTDKPVPVIKPTNTQDAKTASLARSNAKERTSQTMGNNVEEETLEEKSSYHVSWGPGLDHEVLARHGDEAIEKAKQHLISRTPKLKEPKYADTFNKKPTVHNVSKERRLQKEGVIDDTIEKGRKWAQDKVKDSPTFKAAQELGHNLPGYEDAKDAKQHFSKGEYKDAAKSTLHSLGKAAATGAAVAGAGYAATRAVPALARAAAAGTVADTIKSAVKGGAGGGPLTPLPQHRAQSVHTAPVSVSRARKHRVHEETGDEARTKDQAVPRLSNKKRTEIDYVGRPNSPRSILTRQGEVTRKVIDEDSKKKANLIKDTVKKKTIEQNLDDDRTKVYGEVVVNPPVNYKNLNDVDQAS